LLASGAAFAQTPVISAEYLLDAETDVNYALRRWPDAARLASGNIVATWPGGDDEDVYGRLFAADGSPLGTAFLVNTVMTSDQSEPHVAALADGGFVIVWTGFPGLSGQRFDSSATPVGTQFQASVATIVSSDPDVAALDDGGFVVVWKSDAAGLFDPDEVRGRRYMADGMPLGPDFLVEDSASGYGTAVAPRADAGFLVTWSALLPFDEQRIDARLFDSSAVAEGPVFAVSTSVGAKGDPTAVTLADGTVVIAWVSKTGFHGVFMQALDDAGAPVGAENALSALPAEPFVSLSAGEGGGFVAGWPRLESGIGARAFDQSLAAVTDELELAVSQSSLRRGAPAVVAGDDRVQGFWIRDAVCCLGSSTPIVQALVGADVCLAGGADTDADGLSDACDPCTSASTIDIKPKLSFSLLTSSAIFNERMKMFGEFVLPANLTFATLNPLAQPIGIRIDRVAQPPVMEASLPTTAFAGNGTAGWTVNSRGTVWKFKDRRLHVDSGIDAVVMSDRSNSAPGRVRIKVKSKNRLYTIRESDLPLNATVVLGDGSAGQCSATAFVAADCAINSAGSSLRCRQ